MTTPRVALVGARRARQGLGPFVARDLAASGIEIAAVLGTSEASAALAARELEQRFGLRVRPYARLDALLAKEPVDALAILSPPETHERYLHAALEARLHTLCEKPLIWGEPDFVRRGAALVEGFRARGLLLEENCQWPHVLEPFRALHPGLRGGPPARFAMLLAPAAWGIDALRDALSHPLSLLQVLCPDSDPHLEAIRFERVRQAPEAIRLSFAYCTPGARVSCDVELRAGAQVPRPAAIEIDGLRAERRIRLPDYAMELADGGRAVPLADPLSRHLAVFAMHLRAVVAGSAPPDSAPIARRLALLGALVDACPAELHDCAG